MWRNNEVSGEKEGRISEDKYRKEKTSEFIGGYPHNEDFKTSKIWLNEGLMKNIHISTALIVLINFYI